MGKTFTISEFIDEATDKFTAGEFVAIIGDEDTDVEPIVSAVSAALTSDGDANEVYREGQDFVYYRITRVDVTERRNPPNDFTPKNDIDDGPTNEPAPINLAIVKHRSKNTPFIALVYGNRRLSPSVTPFTTVNNAALHAIFDLKPNSIFKLINRYYYVIGSTIYEVSMRVS